MPSSGEQGEMSHKFSVNVTQEDHRTILQTGNFTNSTLSKKAEYVARMGLRLALTEAELLAAGPAMIEISLSDEELGKLQRLAILQCVTVTQCLESVMKKGAQGLREPMEE